MAHIDIVFDGPPGPEAGRFVEVEDAAGKSMRFGTWVHRPDGFWVLRISTAPVLDELKALLRITEHDGSQWISADAFDELIARHATAEAFDEFAVLVRRILLQPKAAHDSAWVERARAAIAKAEAS